MKVHTMLARKGTKVTTVPPDATIGTAVRLLKENRIGALVVSADGERVDGILSERDIVRALGERGAGLLDTHVSDLMTSTVKTCAPDDGIEALMTQMTESRIRHLPVVEHERLAGIISIGDVVKTRLEELEAEATALRDYVGGRV